MSTNPILEPIPIKATAPIIINPSTTSKKRSREEVSPEDEEMGGTLPPSRTPGISPTAIAGKGMARINPLTGTATTAESQSGTWFEDQLEKKLQPDIETAAQLADSDDELPKRKVPRRDASNTDLATAPNLPEITDSPRVAVADPTIDQYTHLLGIGWTHVGEDSAAMIRGFSRYIDNHYPLITDPEVLCKSKSTESYLVKASQGYYLFPEDLQQGWLVARTWENTVHNLQSRPLRFLSTQPLFAVMTPVVSEKDRESDNGTAASAKAVQGEDVEMEMD